MSKAEEYLKGLDERSVWIFTKQETDFDDAFKSTKLFYEIPNKDAKNIEQYFTENHTRYEIDTHRHRILVMPQLFGLITKTPFYQKRTQYGKEKITEIFDLIKGNTIADETYNIIKTEQLLKLKIHAIVDTANNNEDYLVLPVVFIYKVLKKLQQKYNIKQITIEQLYTYVMTCKNYEQVNDAVEFIRENAPISEYVSIYKSLSRIVSCLKKNTKLFDITTKTIAINPKFDEYFYNNFILKYDFDELHEQLLRDVDYSYFLYSYQKFNINLIDEPEKKEIDSYREKVSISAFIDDEDNENNYLEKVNSINEFNVNEDVSKEAHKTEPVATKKFEVGRKFKVNPLLGKIAIQRAYYCCEIDHAHETFLSNKTNKNYMEAHHLIPVCNQQKVWDIYKINIDCVENLVSLCPTCHKAFHYGTKEVKMKIIKEIYEKIQPKYKSIDFNIALEEIMNFYNIG